MAVQGGNSIDHNAALAGMVVDGQLTNVVSKLNDSTSVNIPFGHGVVRDGDDGVALPTNSSTAADFVGINQRELNRVALPSTNEGVENTRRDLSVLTMGVIYASPVVSVNDGDNVFLVIGTSGATANVGRFSNVAGSGANTAVEIPNAKWTSTAAANGLAKISLVVGG